MRAIAAALVLMAACSSEVDEVRSGDPRAGDGSAFGDTAVGDSISGDGLDGDPGAGDPGSCIAAGDTCTRGSDCCNGSCVGSSDMRCAVPTGCTTRHEPCVGSRQCCSGLCATVCVPLGGCAPAGEVCSVASATSAECCSGVCELNGTVLRCADPAGCQDAGELCGEGASNNCCDPGGGTSGSTWCVDVGDGSRCTGYSCSGPECVGCLPDGRACAVPEDCCGGSCALSSDTVLRCAGVLCAAEGASCEATGDCCAGTCGSSSACEP